MWQNGGIENMAANHHNGESGNQRNINSGGGSVSGGINHHRQNKI